MKITFKRNRFPITFYVPLFIFRLKIVRRFIKKYLNDDLHFDVDALINNTYLAIKDYIKEQGRFVLVEADSKDGYVKIKL